MTRTQQTALPENTHKLQKIAAKAVHLGCMPAWPVLL